jgi:hypothetical protein
MKRRDARVGNFWCGCTNNRFSVRVELMAEISGEALEYESISDYNPDFDNDVSVILKIAQLARVPSAFYSYNPEPEPFVGTYLVGKRHYSSVLQYLSSVETTEDCMELLSFFPGLGKEDILYLKVNQIGLNSITAEQYDTLRSMVYGETYLYSDFPAYESRSRSIILNYTRKVAQEAGKLQEQNDLYERFKKMPRLYCSLTEILETKVTYRPRIIAREDGFYSGVVTENYGIDIFEAAIVNENVPFVKYIDPYLRQFTKIYTGKDYTILPSFDKTVVLNNPSPVSNSIHITIWCGNPAIPVNKRQHLAGEYVSCIYDLVNNRVRVDCKTDLAATHNRMYQDYTDAQERLLGYLQTSFPNLDFQEKETAYRGQFYMGTPQPYNEMQIADFIRNDALYAHYFYVEEKKNLNIIHKSFDLGFRSGDGDANIKVHNELLSKITLFMSEGLADIDMKPSNEIPLHVIRVRFMDARSKEAINNLYKIARCLFNVATPPGTFVFPRSALSQTSSLGISQSEISLTELFPKIFPASAYNTSVGKFRKPVVTTEPTERSRPFYDAEGLRAIREKRKPEPLFYVHCTEPYTGTHFVVNKSSNSDLYPYWPYCRTGMDPRGEYVSGVLPQESTGKRGAGAPVVLNKFLAFYPGVSGLLPPEISGLIKALWDHKDEVSEPQRLPSPVCPNTLIYAVLSAFISISPGAFEESSVVKYLKEERFRIAAATSPALLSQELYDCTEDEIRQRLTSEENFDANLFFRAVEEYYNINIIVFDGNEKNPQLDIPRHRFFHARIFRRRKLLLLIKMKNGNGAAHYELIKRGINIVHEATSFFAEKMCKMYNRSIGSYRWYNTEKSYNLQNVAHLPLISNTMPIGQYIDTHGKAYGFRFLLNKDEVMDILCVPTQPVNAPVIREGMLERTKLETVKSIFGRDPVSTYQGHKQSGVWYPFMGMTHGIYIPVREEVPPVGPPHYSLTLHTELSMRALHDIKREAFIVDFLFKWLYHGSDNPISFWQRYVTVAMEEVTYDFRNLSIRLPSYDRIEKKIKYLERTGMTRAGVIIFSKELGNNMYLRLLQYSKYVDPNLPFYTLIPRFYEHSFDVPKDDGVLAFVRIADLENWYKSLIDHRIKYRVNVVHQGINRNLQNQEESFTYRAPNGALYLVQNCRVPTLQNALEIAQHWRMYQQNFGFDYVAKEESEGIPEHVVWGLDSNFRLTKFFEYVEGTQYLEVLNYHTLEDLNNPAKNLNPLYAALLPLHDK